MTHHNMLNDIVALTASTTANHSVAPDSRKEHPPTTLVLYISVEMHSLQYSE